MDVIDAIRQIEQDFENRWQPFDDVVFPEERLLEEAGTGIMEHDLRLISAFATFDYNRNANQLVDKLIELYNTREFLFEPGYTSDVTVFEDSFSSVGLRYPNRDAQAWNKNCSIIQNKYHGNWHELLLSVGCDAPTLVERLNEDDFNCLKGVKIAPMYARIINQEVCNMHNLWRLDIPVDTHIRQLSLDLFQDSTYNWFEPLETDDEIRALWRDLGQEKRIARHIVDAALWQIGNKWDEWGEDYWNEVTA